MKGIGSVKIQSDYKQVGLTRLMTDIYCFQLCAGVKMPVKQTPLFFTYTGQRNQMRFRKMSKPIPGWRPKYLDVSFAVYFNPSKCLLVFSDIYSFSYLIFPILKKNVKL